MSSRPHPDTQIWPPHRAAMAVECPVCGAAPDEACEVDGEPCVPPRPVRRRRRSPARGRARVAAVSPLYAARYGIVCGPSGR